MAAAKAAADLGSAAFPQAITAALLNDKHDNIVKWRGEWLRARYDALTKALRAALPEWTWPEPDGGLTLWVRLPQAEKSAWIGAPGRQWCVRPGRAQARGCRGPRAAAERQRWRGGAEGPSRASEYLRLAFTQTPDVLARAAVARLAAAAARAG